MSKIIIGLTGPMVTGKGTFADYLKENYNATVYGFSGPLRDVLKRLNLPIVRENLAKLSEVLRATFGQNLISTTISNDIQEDNSPIIVLDGIRRMSDLVEAQKLAGFTLVSITAEQKTRYERLLKRTQNVDDQSKTFEQFQADELAEADRQIPEVMTHAQIKIENEKDFDALFAQADELMKRLLNK